MNKHRVRCGATRVRTFSWSGSCMCVSFLKWQCVYQFISSPQQRSTYRDSTFSVQLLWNALHESQGQGRHNSQWTMQVASSHWQSGTGMQAVAANRGSEPAPAMQPTPRRHAREQRPSHPIPSHPVPRCRVVAWWARASHRTSDDLRSRVGPLRPSTPDTILLFAATRALFRLIHHL
jgi:hypothetical protein